MSDNENITTKEILSGANIATTIRRLAYEILESCRDDKPAFVGIYTRGVTLAKRVAAVLAEEGHEFPTGTLDISLYRDDLDNLGAMMPKLESSDVPFALEGTRVILFDEVIFTGRTIRAALDGLMDYGRPSKIELAVLADRGNRELPIQPDYVGTEITTTLDEYVEVRFREDDGEDGVFLIMKKAQPNL